MAEFRIGRRIVSSHGLEMPYFVAEIGVNYEGSLERAKSMIKEASLVGADAVKFQAYRASTLASVHSPSYWDTTKEPTTSQYELFKKMEGFWKEEFTILSRIAKDCGVDFLMTPFDEESVDFLEPLVPAYKIASADITTKPLIQRIAKKGKPIILSTGAASVSEIWRALEWIKQVSDVQVALLHCVLNYPTDLKHASLGAIKAMSSLFPDNVIGYSDHTVPEDSKRALYIAWLLGAHIIEKHYTWNKKLRGNDHYHSFDRSDLKNFISEIKTARIGIGRIEKSRGANEIDALKYARRSLVAQRRIEKGSTLRSSDLTWKRPGTGIPPWLIDSVVGGKALATIERDELLTFRKVSLNSETLKD